MLELPLDYVQISPVFTPPNAALYEMLKRKMNRDYWSDYTIDITKRDPLPRFGTDLTEEQIKRCVRKCYLKFYLRFGYIAKIIFKLKSWNEFTRSIKAIRDMLFAYCLDD
mgnify:FL=1